MRFFGRAVWYEWDIICKSEGKSRVLKIVMVNIRICILAIFIIKIQEVAMMNEEEKIKNVLDKYNKYFADTNSDVCHSIKGVWFFYQYDSKILKVWLIE